MVKQATYDWDKIEKEYIQGIKTRDINTGELTITYPTHAEIISKYGMHQKTLEDRSARDKWSMRRKQYQNKLKYKNSEVNFDDILGESAKFDAIALQNLEQVGLLISHKLKPYVEIMKANDDGDESIAEKYLDEEGNSTLPPLTVRDLKDLASTTKEIVTTVRTILGEGTTENLLDNIRDQLAEEYDNKRKQRKLPASFIKSKLKQMDEIEKQASELQLRRDELKKMLDER